MRRSSLFTGFAAMAATAALISIAPAQAHSPGAMGPGMGGPGMAGPGMMQQGGCPGMGQGMYPGMMGQGMMGGGMMGPGMMGPGMMGGGMMGPGMMGGGMMGQGMYPGMMGQGMYPGMMGQGAYSGMYPGMMGQRDLDLSVKDVQSRFQRWLAIMGNPRLKLGNVAEKDADTITADIVTTDKDALVQRYAIDRHTGFYRPVE